MRTLGLDIGDRRIGVALSDPEEILASPLTIITREDDEKAIADIIKLVDQHNAERIVLGMPYSLDGSIGRQANKVMDFAERLSKHTRASMEIWDERLSTVAVERLLREAGSKKAKKRVRRDDAAAAFILQGYLDSLKVCD
ncbi:MAG: Holliday junction resolvase RuvX [Dehalococcoidia bacterium]|nr:Holliday junction resolvase RuvX [Dehalococcoidia bacterium]